MRLPNLCLQLLVLALVQIFVTSQPNRYQRHFNFRNLELQPNDPSVSFEIKRSNSHNIDISKLAMSFNLRLADQTIEPPIPFMAIFLDSVKVIQVQIVPGSIQTVCTTLNQLTTVSIGPVLTYRNWGFYDFEISYNSSSSSNQFKVRAGPLNIHMLGNLSPDPESLMIRFGTADSDLQAKSQV